MGAGREYNRQMEDNDCLCTMVFRDILQAQQGVGGAHAMNMTVARSTSSSVCHGSSKRRLRTSLVAHDEHTDPIKHSKS